MARAENMGEKSRNGLGGLCLCVGNVGKQIGTIGII